MGSCCGKNGSDEDILACITKVDDAAFVLAKIIDMLKVLIDCLANSQGDLMRVNKISTDIHDLQKHQEAVTTQMGITMACICEMLEIAQKKLKKRPTESLKTRAYLEEEQLLPTSNKKSLQLQPDTGNDKKGTSNPTDKIPGETTTLTESSPLLSKFESRDNEQRGIDDNSVLPDRKENDVLVPRCTTTLHIIQQEEKEHEDTCKSLSTKIDELQSNINMLMPKLDLTNHFLEEEMSKNRLFFHTEVHKLEEQKINYECTSILYEEKLAYLQVQLQKELEKNEQFEISIEKLKLTLKNKEEQLQEITISLDRTEKEKASASEQAKEVQLTLNKTKKDLSETEAQLDHEIFGRKQTEAELKAINMSLKDKEHHFKEAVEALKQDKIKYEANVFELQQITISLEQRIQSLVGANELLTKRLTEQSILRVQVYCPSQSEMMLKVEKEMISLIQTKLEHRTKEFEFVKCIQTADVNQSLPTLLLCINTSRLGTDVSSILQKFQANSKMAVIVFHHKDSHALPNESSSRVLIGQVFKLLGGIFDIAFLSDKGIYSCKMNEDNISKLIHFLVNFL